MHNAGKQEEKTRQADQGCRTLSRRRGHIYTKTGNSVTLKEALYIQIVKRWEHMMRKSKENDKL